MSPRLLLGTVAPIVATPIVALLAMAAMHVVPFEAALVASGLTLLSALLLAAVWLRDLRRLEAAVRYPREARSGERGDGQEAPAAATLPPLQPIADGIEKLARGLTEQATLLRRLREIDAAIVERLPDALITLDAGRGVARTNAAARGAFGEDLPAVLRHPVLRGSIDRALAQGTPQHAELTIPVPIAREVHAAVFAMDPPLADGGQVVIVLSDRTRERVVERTRADFVANASHELRTPLASLIGFIETLRGPAANDPAAQQRFLAIMGEQAARMNRIIDDLLSLSRIEMAERQPPAERLQLGVMATRIIAGFEPRLAERRIRMDAAIPTTLPDITADADQIAQVLQNLLDNAVKYGREAGTVRLRIEAADGAAPWPARPGLVLSIGDDGNGIPREHLPRLTERFYRVDTGRSREVGGTGLGLAIVKHIVNRHRGQLAITSTLGAGTTVSVWLPQASASHPAPGPARPSAPGSGLKVGLRRTSGAG